ncbi:MAG: CDP-glycerol glycerophosphotransferase family protein, partial [Selenomonadaceae bacterium]|nr:CDP-glycerol glycerophosphotransferase family protein [Selenomonadaceae bacterium]
KNIVSLTPPAQPEYEQRNLAHAARRWLANLRHIESYGADYFATGCEFMRDGWNTKFIPSVSADINSARGGVNLADANQDLRQSYLTAKYIFAHVKPGTIKFVLIGLMPYSFVYSNNADFLSRAKGLQYALALDEPTAADELIMNLVSDDFKKNFAATTAEQSDINLDGIKLNFGGGFYAGAIGDWEDVQKNFSADLTDDNVQILKDYIELCRANNAEPIGVLFPFAPAVRRNYNKKILTNFREILQQVAESHDFTCVDMFELNLNYDCYHNMMNLNTRGQSFVNALLAAKIYRQKNLIPVENFCAMNYNYFHNLSWILPKDEFAELMEKIFDAAAQMIARKNKIKVGFVTIDSAQWCGDDLYNLFARDERFDVTIFDCLRTDKKDNALIKKDFLDGVEQFKSRGLNVIALDDKNSAVPEQDVLIYLTPYSGYVPAALNFGKLPVRNLITHIPYSLDIAVRDKNYYNSLMFHAAWRLFFSSTVGLEVYASNSTVGMPRGFFSGYPRMDIFFDSKTKFNFKWKTARPKAKKIIWAPHWSINDVTRYATFQWNYKFMYEFAKAHPEISWVVKPHQALFASAVKEKVFPSVEALDEYFQAWNNLPNAQVVTGAYYQDIFATSDGLIHDSGSFIAEYQYVDKPMIFLTREGEIFNDLGNEILNVSYCVDGKDFDAIAEIIQRVVIKGKDDKSAARRKVFDKHLNYPKINGMLASEFIFKTIADKFKTASA